MENFIVIFAMFLGGVILQYAKVLPRDSAQWFNIFVIYISLPALVLLNIHKLHFSGELLVPVALPWIMLTVSAILVFGLSKLLNFPRSVTGVLMLLVPLGNTSFLGIPMVHAFFGEEGIPYVILYDQFGSFLALATYGTIILAIFSGSQKPSIRQIIKRVFFFPPFIALIIGLCLKPIVYPPAIDKALNIIAETLVPVVMTAVGLQMNFRFSRRSLSPLFSGLTIKLVAAPLIALLLCSFLQKSLAVNVSIFEAGMGPMLTAGAMAISENLEPELTAFMLALGMIMSFITLPLLFQLL